MDLNTLLLLGGGLLLLIGLVGINIFLSLKKSGGDDSSRLKLLEDHASLEAKIDQQNRQIGELERIKEQHDKQSGIVSALEKQIVSLKTENDQYLERLKGAGKKLSDLEAREEQRETEKTRAVQEASKMKDVFEEQKDRIIEKEEEKKEKEKEERNRIWNDHETNTIASLREICRKPGIDFPSYDNNDLPQSFDGKFKPDFLVEFLGQYIVFDAKVNDPDSKNPLQKYLKEQSKSTAEKIKKSSNFEEIYNTVYLVVPSVTLKDLNQFYFLEQGIHFYVVAEESLEPLLSCFKKITYYENIESIDPRERENIINVIANLDYELSYQNAVNVLLMARGVKAGEAKQVLDQEMIDSINEGKEKRRLEGVKTTDLKKLVNNPEGQIEEVKKMVNSTDPLINSDSIKSAQNSLL